MQARSTRLIKVSWSGFTPSALREPPPPKGNAGFVLKRKIDTNHGGVTKGTFVATPPQNINPSLSGSDDTNVFPSSFQGNTTRTTFTHLLSIVLTPSCPAKTCRYQEKHFRSLAVDPSPQTKKDKTRGRKNGSRGNGRKRGATECQGVYLSPPKTTKTFLCTSSIISLPQTFKMFPTPNTPLKIMPPQLRQNSPNIFYLLTNPYVNASEKFF